MSLVCTENYVWTESPYRTSMPGPGAVHHIRFGLNGDEVRRERGTSSPGQNAGSGELGERLFRATDACAPRCNIARTLPVRDGGVLRRQRSRDLDIRRIDPSIVQQIRSAKGNEVR